MRTSNWSLRSSRLGEDTKLASGELRLGSGYSAAIACPIGFWKNDGTWLPGNGCPLKKLMGGGSTLFEKSPARSAAVGTLVTCVMPSVVRVPS